MSDETSALLRSLDNQRRHVLRIVEGLADDDLRRPVLPTGWTCLSLVQHLALDIEEFWFWNVAAGQTTPPGSRVADAWQVAADVPVGEVLDRYRQETERATGARAHRRAHLVRGEQVTRSGPAVPSTVVVWRPAHRLEPQHS